MFSQWVFLSVLAFAVPSVAWAEGVPSDLGKEHSEAEQGDKRGDELFAEFTRLRQAAETGAAGNVRFRRLLLPATELRQCA